MHAKSKDDRENKTAEEPVQRILIGISVDPVFSEAPVPPAESRLLWKIYSRA
jgi:hypothetical protein